MKITNLTGLPEPLYRAIAGDGRPRYRPTDGLTISVTELLKPSRLWALERRHDEVLEEDAADRLFSLFGQLGHLALERAAGRDKNALISSLASIAADPHLELAERIAKVEALLHEFHLASGISECRHYVEHDGVTVTGQYDLLDAEAIVTDYKFCSLWVAKEGVKPEWTAQQNLYGWQRRKLGLPWNGAQIVAIYRDWSKSKADFEDGYPKQQVQVFPVPIWTLEEQEDYLSKRIASHRAALAAPDAELPLCSPEERWERDSKWAVYKAGNKRATKLYDDLEPAYQHAEALGGQGKADVRFRPGRSTRCESYCAVGRAGLCRQWNLIKEQSQAEEAA